MTWVCLKNATYEGGEWVTVLLPFTTGLCMVSLVIEINMIYKNLNMSFLVCQLDSTPAMIKSGETVRT